jgi:1-acyl-sn-glycerol-3-phosphate acyltransferase
MPVLTDRPPRAVAGPRGLPARTSEGLRLRATAHLSTAALVVTAAWSLWSYQAWARVRGPAPARAVGMLQRWSRRAWRSLRLDVRVEGRPSSTPCVYVANHRSYLDIPLLAGVLGTSFMSRADIASWPIVGAAARATGAVFVERNDLGGRIRAARTLTRRLRTGSLVVFPEGTTTGERLPGVFNPGLFRLLHRLGAPVIPVTIRYAHPRAYWIDDVTLSAHLLTRVFGPSPLTVAVHIGERLDARAHTDGASLARAAYAAVCRPIEELGELA